MSWLGDVFDFEKFAFGDMLGQIKDDPERLLLGAATPIGSKVWGGILGKDWKDEPILDYFGGPASGTYDRAQAAGIDTKAGGQAHDVAKAIASIYAGGYGLDKAGAAFGGGGGAGGSGGSGGGLFGGEGGLFGGGSGGAGGLDWQSMLGNLPMGGQQQQQQPQMPQIPVSRAPQLDPSLAQMFPGLLQTPSRRKPIGLLG